MHQTDLEFLMHPLLGALLVTGERQRRWWSWCWWPPRWRPAARHAAVWVGALALAVSVASFAPEAAFVWALTGGGGGDHDDQNRVESIQRRASGSTTGELTKRAADVRVDHDDGVPFVESVSIFFPNLELIHRSMILAKSCTSKGNESCTLKRKDNYVLVNMLIKPAQKNMLIKRNKLLQCIKVGSRLC
jgi:hypothetical protein